MFVGEDEFLECSGSRYDARASEKTKLSRREVSLHTFHYRKIPIIVTDSTCGYCRSLVAYDGLRDGLFCVNKKNAFSIELLDIWLWDICGSGGKFRDAYSSWAFKSTAFSASFHRIVSNAIVHRKICNDAFTLFLKLLKFPRDEDLYRLFSCSIFETRDASSENMLKDIVMDGTALGIISALPNFSRHTRVLKPVKGVPDKQ